MHAMGKQECSILTQSLLGILRAPGPVFCSIKVRVKSLDFVLPSNNGVILKNRIRNVLYRDYRESELM